ncbi:MAG TPA: histidine phosphatase family protein [Bacteroidales bacterium]|nr:histidine phosphatase family protein [Bacteroidales bacterium]
MKKLIFVRHGKAEEDNPGISDFERSLTTSGKKVSGEIARAFFKKEVSAGMMISSPAFRALETALIFAAEEKKGFEHIVLKDALYFGTDIKKLNRILIETDNSINTITLFGHNPSFSEIPDSLSKNGCESLPKSGVVCLSFETNSWNEIDRNAGRIEYFLKPGK